MLINLSAGPEQNTTVLLILFLANSSTKYKKEGSDEANDLFVHILAQLNISVKLN